MLRYIHFSMCMTQLKKVIGEREVVSELSKETVVQDELLELEKILKTQELVINGNKVFQVLVKWKGKIVDEATWMNYYDFCN